MDDSPLVDATLEQRHAAAIDAVRERPDDGDLLLSYVIWPDRIPPLRAIALSAAFARRRHRMATARRRPMALAA